MDRFEGLVLLGLGRVAMSSFVVTLSEWVSQRQRTRRGWPDGCDRKPRATLAGRGRQDEHARRARGVVCAVSERICAGEVTEMCENWAENGRRLQRWW